MAETITWEVLRSLASFRAERGCVISLYLDLDPSVAPTQPDVAARIKALLSSAQRKAEALRGSLAHEPREALKADLERMQRWFDTDFDRGDSLGAAVFADSPDGLWRTFTLAEPVAEEVRFGRELHLAPLVGLIGKGDGALVAYVGRERAEVYRLEAGHLRPIADETEDVPGQHDQGGWSQPRYQRHIEAIVGRHLRRVAESLVSCVRGSGRTSLVLIGPEEIRADFEELLSNDVRECIIGWTAAEAHATAAELLAAARPVIDAWWSSKEAHLLDRWREAAGRDGRASAGWEKTLEAASDGRVAQLLVQQGADRNAYRCPVCGRARTTNGVCPLDGAELEEHDDALDVALHHTLAHGGTVTLIRKRRDLEPVEGIGALLRF